MISVFCSETLLVIGAVVGNGIFELNSVVLIASFSCLKRTD